jgi:peroxiredoxin
MNHLKSVFISLYMTMLAAGIFYSAFRIAIEGPTTPWMGLAIASIVPGAFFMQLFLAPVARTSENLRWMPLLGLIAACIPVTLAPNQPWALITALLNGVIGPVIYIRWYSRFGGRDTTTLALGNMLPSFDLIDSQGQKVSSTDLSTGTTLWLFFRGNWCPLCMAQIQEVAHDYQALAARGVRVCLVSPQPESNTQQLAKQFKVPMEFYSDANNAAARKLGILAEGGLPAGLQALGYDSDVPMPTVIISKAGGEIIYSDLTENYRIRPEPEDFMAALDAAEL